MKAARLVASALGIAVLSGCAAPAPAPDGLTGTVTVLAAASLTGPLDEVADRFMAGNPAVEVTISYGGSSALAQQIVEGSPADVFFSANEVTMKTVSDAELAIDPAVVLSNTLEIAVPTGNPAEVTGLADFARPELAIALCDPAVPCGSAAAQLLVNAGVTPSVDTLEEDVKAVLAKVALGEVDAALVYRTDVLAAGERIEGIEVPEAAGVVNRYPISLLARARDNEAAVAFVAYLRSTEGVEVFLDAGFGAG
jgi:molybdate transport system substrate-binding protein